jgi:hypothetical protein
MLSSAYRSPRTQRGGLPIVLSFLGDGVRALGGTKTEPEGILSHGLSRAG